MLQEEMGENYFMLQNVQTHNKYQVTATYKITGF